MWRLFFLLYLGLAGSCMAMTPVQPAPVLVFIESNPWSSVIGGAAPRVAVYENGDVIYQAATTGASSGFRRGKLDPRALDDLLAKAAAAFVKVEPKQAYGITQATDQPIASFYLHVATREAAVSVYGLGCHERSQSPWGVGKGTKLPPEALLDLNRTLCKLDIPGGEAWSPSQLEVLLWDYRYAPDPSTPWPTKWPSLSSPGAVKRENLYSIYLDASALPELQALLASRKPKGAILIDGQKMAASYRWPLPQESVWMKAIDANMASSP